MTRQTSIYQIDLDNGTDADLEHVVENLADVFNPAGKYDGPDGTPLAGEQTGSGFSDDRWKTPFVRVRVANDAVARAVAREICGEREFSIRTGFGVHQRWLP